MKAEQKCPKCGAEVAYKYIPFTRFKCNTRLFANGEVLNSPYCDEQVELTTLRQRVQELEEGSPIEQPLVDMPMDRQIVMLNRQVVHLTKRVQQVEDALKPFAGMIPYTHMNVPDDTEVSWGTEHWNGPNEFTAENGWKPATVGDLRKAAEVLAHTLAPTIEKKATDESPKT